MAGVINAYDEFEAVAKIKETCDIVLKVEQVKARKERIDLNEPLWVSDKVLSLTSAQFSILLKAGLPMPRTVEVIAEQTSDRLMKKILKQVAQDTSAGYSLAQSFETRGKKLPVTFIETVRAGEQSGTLETSFDKLKVYYEKNFKTKSKVRGALMYPAFLCVLAVIVVGIIMVVTVPELLGAIDSYGTELPLPTAMLIGISTFMTKWWGLLLAILASIAVAVRIYAKTEKGRVLFSRWALTIPVWGRVNRMRGAAQFANTLSTLLAAGLPMTQALAITGRVMDNYVIGISLKKAVVGIEEGKKLGDVLNGNSFLPPLLTEMAGVGEESGALEETLDTIGAYYDSEAESASTKVLSMMEPAITVFMGGIVGFIVIAIYLGMFASYGVQV